MYVPKAASRLPSLPLAAHHHSGTLMTLAPWDSVFFTRIARCGYETDQIHAFFPLLPAGQWTIAQLLCEWWWWWGLKRLYG